MDEVDEIIEKQTKSLFKEGLKSNTVNLEEFESWVSFHHNMMEFVFYGLDEEPVPGRIHADILFWIYQRYFSKNREPISLLEPVDMTDSETDWKTFERLLENEMKEAMENDDGRR